ncbi:hypothetical protein PVAP13_1NG501138 [Panicum virgatum]|uniref:Uncharacterized protein n=1 Tax=Panicum virgatum TaxID=38727 RepID=A0A8T0XH43_PANVG|nr:hypothetical protein PVAP13_1NG501138 [Panicum virgatum]
MGSRRFLNLIVNNRIPPGTLSLRCIDLMRQQFFNTTTPAQSPNGNGSESVAGCQKHKQVAGEALKMERISLPSPSFSIRSSPTSTKWNIDCVPLAGRKVFCTDHSGRTIIFDTKMRHVDILPTLHRPKWEPISIFVPSDAADNHDDVEGSIFVMERVPDPEYSGQPSSQFEDERPPKISSYAVVGGGGGGSGSSSLIYIAAEEGAGTYSLDTVRHTWSRLGDCALPFHGKVEYVPELKLWFGISSKDWTLAAADLSAMGSQTQLVSLVNLGCGRFCIVRFFYTSTTLEGYFDEVLEEEYSDEEYEEYFVILTGVEVVRCDNYVSGNDSKGKVELKMIKHNSMYHMCYDGGDGKIETAF